MLDFHPHTYVALATFIALVNSPHETQEQQQFRLEEQFVIQMRFSRLSVRAPTWDMDVDDTVHNNCCNDSPYFDTLLLISIFFYLSLYRFFIPYLYTLLLIPLFIPAVLLDTYYSFYILTFRLGRCANRGSLLGQFCLSFSPPFFIRRSYYASPIIYIPSIVWLEEPQIRRHP
ncbi:hypothetical protein BDA99DRAFT_572476 [Phascolomyces articulosus]|uniref:Uncharacterized protein n=1 Tax=Phascolomyces articulosus TaxID=60185 RepID=A0AAD5K964_9FUNG|nr:hypothetical protein BDA99DRAFT_572476 [Phascolomyces articulosus]